MARSSRRLLSIITMLRELRTSTGAFDRIERRPKPPAKEFFARYVATATPVVLTDASKGWKALGKWRPEYLERKLGHIDVQVTTGRNADPDYDRNTPAHSRVVKMAEFARRVARAKRSTNDFYMVANNHAMTRAGMDVLVEDVLVDPEYFDPAQGARAMSLWFGPKGTVTPLHHDTTSIVFHQIYGSKRFLLLSPFETALLGRARGVYCDVDPEQPDRYPELRGVPILSVELAPGDSLFIPVGWWHHVRGLEVSISLSFTNLRVQNNYDWYHPGDIA